MSVTETQSISISTSGGRSLAGSVIESGSSEINIDQTYAGGSSNVELDIAFTDAGLQSVFLISNQPLTIGTNSSATPSNTINLVAGAPLIWSRSSGYFPCPFTADVTKFFITCTTTARLQGKILSA
jgi:hypothetical protein